MIRYHEQLVDTEMLQLLAESYLHGLDPFAIRFTENFGLRWYGLSYATGFVLAWLFIRWMARTGRTPLTTQTAGDLMFYAVVGVLVGGRVGYAVFYDFSLLFGFTGDFPFWDLLAINKGGMASHGGMIGVVVALIVFARKHKYPAPHLWDLGALTCTAGFFLGRLANFVNAELWGRALPQSMRVDPPWWSVKYPEEITQNWLRMVSDPAGQDLGFVRQLAGEFGISNPDQAQLRAEVADEAFRRLGSIESQLHTVIAGDSSFYDQVINAAKDSSAATHERVVEVIQPLLTPYYPSQIIQALTDGLLVAIILALLWLKPRKPGVIGCWYLIVYGVLRIATEFLRQPDEGVSLLFGLSRGQVLSVAMIVVGFIILGFCVRRDAEPLGGLLKQKGG